MIFPVLKPFSNSLQISSNDQQALLVRFIWSNSRLSRVSKPDCPSRYISMYSANFFSAGWWAMLLARSNKAVLPS